MSDDPVGIDILRGAIDRVAQHLPEGSGRRPRRALALALFAAAVVAAAAIVMTRPVRTPAPADLGVEVMLLRFKGRDVGARVFVAAAAGSVVVAPDVTRTAGKPPIGAALRIEGGPR